MQNDLVFTKIIMLFHILIVLVASINSQEICKGKYEVFNGTCHIGFTKIRLNSSNVCCDNKKTCGTRLDFGCSYNSGSNSFTLDCTDLEKQDPSRQFEVCPIPRKMSDMLEAFKNDDDQYMECEGTSYDEKFECLDVYNVGYNGLDRSDNTSSLKFLFEKLRASQLLAVPDGYDYLDKNMKKIKGIPFALVFVPQINIKFDIQRQLHLLPVGYFNNSYIECSQNGDCEEEQFCGEALIPNRTMYCYSYPPVHRYLFHKYQQHIDPEKTGLELCDSSNKCDPNLHCVGYLEHYSSDGKNYFNTRCLAKRRTDDDTFDTLGLALFIILCFVVTISIASFIGITTWTCLERFIWKSNDDAIFETMLEEALPSESEAETERP